MKPDFTKKHDKNETTSYLKKQYDLAIKRLEDAKARKDEKATAKNLEIVNALAHTLGIKEK